jgi:hypothetical protein
MKLEDKLRALVAGMRYAADRCDEYASRNGATPWFGSREAELARASAMRSDASALEALLNEHDRDEATRAAR